MNQLTAYLTVAIAVTSLQIIPTIITDTATQPIDRITILRQVIGMKNIDIADYSASTKSDTSQKVPSTHTLAYFRQFSDPKVSVSELLARTTEEQGLLSHFTGFVCQSLRTITVLGTRLFSATKLTQLWRRILLSSTNYFNRHPSLLPWSKIVHSVISHPSTVILPLNLLTVLVSYPFDVVKTRMITDLSTLEDCLEREIDLSLSSTTHGPTAMNNIRNSASASATSVLGNSKKHNDKKSIFDTVVDFVFGDTWRQVKHMYERQGLWAFYRGVDIALLSMVPTTLLNGFITQYVKAYLPRSSGPWTKFLVALLIRCSVSALLYPLDVAKRRMMMKGVAGWRRQGIYHNSFDCLVKMVKQEGVASLYSGYRTHLLRQLPNSLMTGALVRIMKYQMQFLTQVLLAQQ